MRKAIPAVLLALFAALFVLPFRAHGDGFSSSGGGVSWPLQVPSGGGTVTQIVGPTDTTFAVASSPGQGITVSAPQNATNGGGGIASLLVGDGGPSGGSGGSVTISSGSTHAAGTNTGSITIGGATHSSGASSGTLTLNNTGGGANVSGGPFTLNAGTNGGANAAGSGTVRAGDASSGTSAGGLMTVRGGNGLSSGAGGNLALAPGQSVSGTDGSLLLQGSSSHAASTVITISGTTATFATPFKISAFAGAGSTTPALGTTCPASSATVHWMQIVDSAGTTSYIPVWQ